MDMVDPSSTHGHVDLVQEELREPAKNRGFFSLGKVDREAKLDEKAVDDIVQVDPKEPDIKPVGILKLFRFSTWVEILLDLIGLVAAAAAGAAQICSMPPLMSLLFGNLTQEFVNFTTATKQAQSGDADSISNLDAAATHFRKISSQNASYLVYLGLGMFVCTFVYMYIWVYTGEVNAKRIREKYLQAILRQEITFFDRVGAGEVTTRIQSDTHLVQQGMSEKVPLTVNYIGAFVCGFVLAYIRSWRLALAMTSILPCFVIIGGVMNTFISGYMQRSLEHLAQGATIAEEAISSVRTAQAFGIQAVLGNVYNCRTEEALKLDLKSAVVHGGSLAIFFFVIYSSYALAFSFGTTLINAGRADPGQVVNVILAILVGSSSLVMLASEMKDISQGRAAAAKLYETIDRVPEIDSTSNKGLTPEKVDGELKLEDITFSYPARPTVPVVKGIDLSLPAGKISALVGASGSGKSTIISLVERFYDPTAGCVRLDGLDIKDLNLRWLRSQIGLVSQEPNLFATTIRGNVAHGLINTPHERASEEEKAKLIKAACVKANADAFISKLPLGYDTLVGEHGFLLSGGQKQCIAIARAIVSDPKILLLDEATSALDTQSESIIQDALDKAAAGRTTIVIAHRLSTVKDADIIYVMGDGRLLEQGTHDEHIALNGEYSLLVQAQMLHEGKESANNSADEIHAAHDTEKAFTREVALGQLSVSQKLEEDRSIVEVERHPDGDHSLLFLFKRMAPFIRDQWKNYGFGAFVACLNGCVYPCFSIIFAKGIEGFSEIDPHERRKDGDRNALWFFVVAILSTVVMGFQNFLFPYAASILCAWLRMASFKAILRQDAAFFDQDQNSTGALTSQLSDNPQKVQGLAGVTLGVIVQSIATVIVGSIFGLLFIWQIGIVGIACTPVLLSAGFVRLHVVVLKDQANKAAHAESAQLACEAAGSIRTVASLTREDNCLHLYSDSLQEPLRRSNKTALWSNLLFSFTQTVQFWVIALIFWWGAVLVSRSEASTFEFFIGLMSTTFSVIQAGNVFSFIPDVSAAKGAGSDIVKLLDNKVDIDAESTAGKVVASDEVRGHISFQDIHLRYPTRPDVLVLRGLSLEVRPGEYVALVGASGSGKSTVMQVIERFYDPSAGRVFLDGHGITELNVQAYRKHIALVAQEPTLYAGTVRFNILLGAIKPMEEVTQQEIEAACRDANILEFIQTLPQGFDTEVGGKGSQLSGGQKQRIAIARALLRNLKVLLLDEATSALDSNSEKVVQTALDQAAKGRTTIAIAHRLSTVQNADRIYFIKEGAVSESGSHDQFLAKRGDYYRYVQLQALTKNVE